MEAREFTLPAAVLRTLEGLSSDGHRAALVGRCVRALLGGRVARDFEVVCSAPVERVLALFPHAVPIAPEGGTVMIPTPAGPVDVNPFRGGDLLEDELATRDFTIDAIAYDPITEDGPTLVDPHAGRRDLDGRRLRTVGPARTRLENDPLLALRAARLVAEVPVEADAKLEEAMAGVRAALPSLGAPRLRQEMGPLLLAPRAGAGLELLRRTGIEAALAPGVLAGAARLVDQLPVDLAVRLAGWLRGTRATKILVRLRFSAPLVRDVECLLALHPLDGQLTPIREPELRRLVKRAGDANLERLFALREAELESGSVRREQVPEIRARLSLLRAARERLRGAGEEALRRTRLAIGGDEVMETLGIGPGPSVGRALGYLTRRVEQDPGCNTAEELRKLLRGWRENGL
jgi:tRNA nucleotidyltransferase (CCA-adding enzyme)